MGDQLPDPDGSTDEPRHGSERTELVRSRWTPKPEQIMILESIFNTGMVNPPKEETVKIRKLLEKFGSVGDANVFYWFQNRRSRSRRRQRQIQAVLAGDSGSQSLVGTAGAILYEPSSTTSAGYSASPSSAVIASSSSSSSSSSKEVNDPFSFSDQMGFPDIMEQNPGGSSVIYPSGTSNLQYQSGFITVFMNGVPCEIPNGPIDMKAMFGQDVVVLHSSGDPVPVNQFGVTLQSLQLGESYFLVSKHS